ncbi:MAG: isoprenylcysteine carboxylmethyltransferase family protein [Bacteroidota bacterium]
MDTASLVLFVIGTMGISIFTLQFSIKKKRSHGIPRFFAFESILLLVLLNAPVWFDQPLVWNQLISWILLLVSIVFAVLGFLLLRLIGKPQGDFENTSKLVTVGLYSFIRHPLYASLLFLGTGIFLKDISIITALLAFVNFVALIATAKREEKEMVEKFGNEYITYMQKTRMFIPFVV